MECPGCRKYFVDKVALVQHVVAKHRQLKNSVTLADLLAKPLESPAAQTSTPTTAPTSAPIPPTSVPPAPAAAPAAAAAAAAAPPSAAAIVAANIPDKSLLAMKKKDKDAVSSSSSELGHPPRPHVPVPVSVPSSIPASGLPLGKDAKPKVSLSPQLPVPTQTPLNMPTAAAVVAGAYSGALAPHFGQNDNSVKVTRIRTTERIIHITAPKPGAPLVDVASGAKRDRKKKLEGELVKPKPGEISKQTGSTQSDYSDSPPLNRSEGSKGHMVASRPYCYVCMRDFNNINDITTHYQSKKHQENLRFSPDADPEIDLMVSRSIPIDSFYCEICKRSFPNENDYNIHIKSKGHKLVANSLGQEHDGNKAYGNGSSTGSTELGTGAGAGSSHVGGGVGAGASAGMGVGAGHGVSSVGAGAATDAPGSGAGATLPSAASAAGVLGSTFAAGFVTPIDESSSLTRSTIALMNPNLAPLTTPDGYLCVKCNLFFETENEYSTHNVSIHRDEFNEHVLKASPIADVITPASHREADDGNSTFKFSEFNNLRVTDFDSALYKSSEDDDYLLVESIEAGINSLTENVPDSVIPPKISPVGLGALVLDQHLDLGAAVGGSLFSPSKTRGMRHIIDINESENVLNYLFGGSRGSRRAPKELSQSILSSIHLQNTHNLYDFLHFLKISPHGVSIIMQKNVGIKDSLDEFVHKLVQMSFKFCFMLEIQIEFPGLTSSDSSTLVKFVESRSKFVDF